MTPAHGKHAASAGLNRFHRLRRAKPAGSGAAF